MTALTDFFLLPYSFQQHYRGPAQIAAEAAGVTQPASEQHTNGSPYITSNFGQPWPAGNSPLIEVH